MDGHCREIGVHFRMEQLNNELDYLIRRQVGWRGTRIRILSTSSCSIPCTTFIAGWPLRLQIVDFNVLKVPDEWQTSTE